MLRQLVTTEIRNRFPNIEVEIGSNDTNVIATIAPIHNSWKPIVICDDGHEVTVFYGNFTHVHYDNYEGDERPAAIAKAVVDELERVFDDKVEFWRSRSMSGMGPIGSGQKVSEVEPVTLARLWSGKDVN